MWKWLMNDLKSDWAIRLKGGLFALIAVLSGLFLVFLGITPIYRLIFLLICIWSSCRFYYFFFYVLERYLGGEKNASVFSMCVKIIFRFFRRRNND